jgi:hypothetical protein
MPLPNNEIMERAPSRGDDPAWDVVAINYSSDQTFTQNPRAIYLSTAGTLKVDTVGGSSGISLALGVGYHPIRITKIYSSGSSSAVGFVLI